MRSVVCLIMPLSTVHAHVQRCPPKLVSTHTTAHTRARVCSLLHIIDFTMLSLLTQSHLHAHTACQAHNYAIQPLCATPCSSPTPPTTAIIQLASVVPDPKSTCGCFLLTHCKHSYSLALCVQCDDTHTCLAQQRPCAMGFCIPRRSAFFDAYRQAFTRDAA